MRQKTLTDPKDIPIIGCDALLSLVEWVKMRRQEHEQPGSEDFGTPEDAFGGTHTTDHHSARADDPSPSDRNRNQHRNHDEEGS
jgi:hypothetical protein